MRACASIWATQLKPSNTTWSSHEERHYRRNPALFIHTASMPRVDSMLCGFFQVISGLDCCWYLIGAWHLVWPVKCWQDCFHVRVMKSKHQELTPFERLSPFLVIGSGLSLFLVMGNQVAECCHRVIQASTVIHTTPKAKHWGFESLKTYLVWKSPFQLYQTTATRF